MYLIMSLTDAKRPSSLTKKCGLIDLKILSAIVIPMARDRDCLKMDGVRLLQLQHIFALFISSFFRSTYVTELNA